MNNTKMLVGIMIIGGLLIPMQPPAAAEEHRQAEPGPQASGSDDKYEALRKEFEALKLDRDNVLAQTKRLLEGKGKLVEMEESQAKLQEESKSLAEKNAMFEAGAKKLEEKIAGLESAQASLNQELSALKSDNETLRKGTALDEMKERMAGLQKAHEGEIAAIQKKYDPLRKYLQDAEKEISKQNKSKEEAARKNKDIIDKLKSENEKAKFKIDELTRRVKEDEAKLKEAANKNKSLGREIKNMPKKFAEIARQNKQLIKETSEMHYNMGVFYTKNQEYDRAVSEFEKSIDINNDNPYAYFNVGYIYAEYLVNRKKAIENFRHYLQLSKGSDKDTNWVKKYLLTWDTYDGKDPLD
ncbi:MAG: tetratricopeptide repeat protein [Candidatus Omnitrophota bacterium]